MELTEQQRAFLEQSRGAATVTLRSDGPPAAVRVGIALIDGAIWSSGVPDRVRTRFLLATRAARASSSAPATAT